ncbi:hypothetical protein [Actinophytocola sp. KF-1]
MPVDDAALQIARARKLWKLMLGSDVHKRIAAGEQFMLLPKDVQSTVQNEPRSWGRKKDIRDEHARTGRRAPLIIKVTIAGSGCDVWMTRANADGSVADTNLGRLDIEDDGSQVNAYEQGDNLTVSGPGAKNTLNNASDARDSHGGVFDAGSNSIARIVEQVPPMVKGAIDTRHSGDADEPIVIMIKAHSRGAVAASRVAEALSGYKGAAVELMQSDPVPGPGQPKNLTQVNLGEFQGEDGQAKAAPVESTLVYSVASGYKYGFTPQKVIGAKRIIISRQDHSAGLANGFVYEGRLYKGSSLNSLPEGVFVDRNKTNQNSLPLEKVATRDEAIAAFKSALGEVPRAAQDWAEVPGWTESREKIITSVLNSFA